MWRNLSSYLLLICEVPYKHGGCIAGSFQTQLKRNKNSLIVLFITYEAQKGILMNTEAKPFELWWTFIYLIN